MIFAFSVKVLTTKKIVGNRYIGGSQKQTIGPNFIFKMRNPFSHSCPLAFSFRKRFQILLILSIQQI